jgi:CheY-like chemotaxis protein
MIERAARDSSRPTDPILIVEDDPDTREAIGIGLQAEGYTVMTAPDGLEALELLDRGVRPCLILLDLMMPVMDGVHFRIEQLNRPEIAAIPVVVVSAFGQLTRAKWLRASDYLPKPIDFDRLLAIVDRVCVRPQ